MNSETSGIRIMIVDDHQMFNDGLASLLVTQDRFSVVAQALSGAQAVETLKTEPIDLVITDISMPGMDGIELTKAIKLEYPAIKVLVLSMHNDAEIVNDVVMSEADGFILKNTGKTELHEAVDRITDNGTFFSKEVLSVMMKRVRKEKKIQNEISPLSERELEILNLICDEHSSQEIADKLFISKRTVDTHRTHILEKTGQRTIVGLIKCAIRNELTL